MPILQKSNMISCKILNNNALFLQICCNNLIRYVFNLQDFFEKCNNPNASTTPIYFLTTPIFFSNTPIFFFRLFQYFFRILQYLFRYSNIGILLCNFLQDIHRSYFFSKSGFLYEILHEKDYLLTRFALVVFKFV